MVTSLLYDVTLFFIIHLIPQGNTFVAKEGRKFRFFLEKRVCLAERSEDSPPSRYRFFTPHEAGRSERLGLASYREITPMPNPMFRRVQYGTIRAAVDPFLQSFDMYNQRRQRLTDGIRQAAVLQIRFLAGRV